jgi:Tfp pilus assembly protein PilE
MGQQQLLLIILGVIIVGIAVAVGITMFTGGARDANRDQVVNDLVNLAAKAQQFYRRPGAMGGGGNSFGDGNTDQLDGQISFDLTAADTANANGVYAIITDGSEGTINAVNTSRADVGSGSSLIIKGWGVETGNDGTNPVQAYVTIGPTSFVTTVVN